VAAGAGLKEGYFAGVDTASDALRAATAGSGARADRPDRAVLGEAKSQAALLRDLFGPLPFRDVAVPVPLLGWNDGAVIKLARAAYEERQLPSGALDNERLLVLADALEKAGCTDKVVLYHLRQQGAVHVRGCWVLDLLLNKG
jgi:hypothetical protein